MSELREGGHQAEDTEQAGGRAGNGSRDNMLALGPFPRLPVCVSCNSRKGGWWNRGNFVAENSSLLLSHRHSRCTFQSLSSMSLVDTDKCALEQQGAMTQECLLLCETINS